MSTVPRPVGFLYESLDELNRTIAGLSKAQAEVRPGGANSIAWTAAHVTQVLESWIVGRFIGLPRHPLLSDPAFGAGAEGISPAWREVLEAISDVHRTARGYCDSLVRADLARTVSYDGSVSYLRSTGLNLEYALLRIAAHHYVHIGEMTTIRSLLGAPIDDNRDWGQRFL